MAGLLRLAPQPADAIDAGISLNPTASRTTGFCASGRSKVDMVRRDRCGKTNNTHGNSTLTPTPHPPTPSHPTPTRLQPNPTLPTRHQHHTIYPSPTPTPTPPQHRPPHAPTQTPRLRRHNPTQTPTPTPQACHQPLDRMRVRRQGWDRSSSSQETNPSS